MKEFKIFKKNREEFIKSCYKTLHSYFMLIKYFIAAITKGQDVIFYVT